MFAGVDPGVPPVAQAPPPTRGLSSSRRYRRAVRFFCEILKTVPRGDPAEVEEASASSSDDCATCVDLWCDRRRVRL